MQRERGWREGSRGFRSGGMENEEQVATPVEVDFGNVVRDEENQGGKDGGAKGPNQCEDKC